MRQAQKRTLENNTVRRTYKKAVKEVVKAIEKGEKTLAESVRIAQKQLGKAAKKGVMKKNTAARKLSRLMKKANTSIKK